MQKARLMERGRSNSLVSLGIIITKMVSYRKGIKSGYVGVVLWQKKIPGLLFRVKE